MALGDISSSPLNQIDLGLSMRVLLRPQIPHCRSNVRVSHHLFDPKLLVWTAVKYLPPIGTLEDARRFLHEATGLPNTISGRERTHTYLRALIVFCWLALEEAVKNEVEKYSRISQAPKAPRKLHDRIVFCFTCLIARRISRENEENTIGDGFHAAREKLLEDRAFSEVFFGRCLEYAENQIPFDEFWNHRRLRNDIVHINAPQIHLTIAEAKATFDYCVRSIAVFTGCPLKHRHYDEWINF
jgi:hypothetical protein